MWEAAWEELASEDHVLSSLQICTLFTAASHKLFARSHRIPVTTPRNTAELITRPLSAFRETREGQERALFLDDGKHSEINGNLTGQE